MKNLKTAFLLGAFFTILSAGAVHADVIFDSNGGTYTKTSETMTEPQAPLRTGYDFAGWVKDDGQPASFDGSRITDEVTLHAQWTPFTYSITLPTNSAITINGGVAEYTLSPAVSVSGINPNASVYVSADISKFHNVNMGEIAVGEEQSITLSETPLTKANPSAQYGYTGQCSVSYPGTYTANVGYRITYQEPVTVGFDVTVYEQDGSVSGYHDEPYAIADVSGACYGQPGSTVTCNIAFSNGYEDPVFGSGTYDAATQTFSYTIPADASEHIHIPVSVTAGNVEARLNYNIQNEDGTYTTHSGSTLPCRIRSTVSPSEIYSAPDGLEDYTVTFEDDAPAMITENKTFNCYLTKNERSITVVMKKGVHSVDTGSTAAKGDVVTLSGETETGYKNLSYSSDDCTVTGNTFTMPDHPVVIYAEAEPIRYNLAYNLNGGTVGEGFSLATRENIPYDEEFAINELHAFNGRAGYTFAGWALSADATEADYQPHDITGRLSATDGATVTLYAVWKPE